MAENKRHSKYQEKARQRNKIKCAICGEKTSDPVMAKGPYGIVRWVCSWHEIQKAYLKSQNRSM